MGKNYIFQLMLVVFLIVSVSLPTNVSAMVTSAESAILMEEHSGRVLYGQDIHTKKRIASITKIMTAVLAIESGKLDDVVKISKRAEGTEGSSLYLRAGDEIKLEELVYGLMLRSGNDAAVAIAEHVGGSLEGFVYLMNEKAAEIGMTNTQFMNPHGLDDHEEHLSTAYDMALLTRYAMQNETYEKVSGTKLYKSDGFGIWRNKNKLLTMLYEYCTGGKTGYTKRASRTLVTTASKDSEDLIAVTIKASRGDWDDHKRMYEWGFQSYKTELLQEEGELEQVKHDFYKGNVSIDRDVDYPLTGDELNSLEEKVLLLRPKEEWEKTGVPSIVGKLQFEIDSELIEDVPIYFSGQAPWEKPTWWESWTSALMDMLGVNRSG
ncbi:D-alanyl-D-alanine carboxypeptidase family protein [Bacillus solimangrovi]|uniref:D-alanyl-D-alanine carboxypeptidase n=1 Tax=Bacillus solimangrovi TaxID=1305675 RepID=A0A1E5LHG7_9BACI|nr:D-alanyl-D-alanine carboxypeptidase family protein [Bacillus solimangrovi]OEH93532.1 D-alanyl-D-alanine carboxypeptidase [Bacillus solimangrovi]